MERNTIENILNFLKTNEDKELPRSWFDSIEKLKLIERLENHIGGIQFKHVGDLNLEGSNIRKLPKYLYVTGYLNLYDCKQLTELPDKLHVGGSFWIDYSNITELPEYLHVRHNLDLQDCKELIKLPNGLHVGESLDLRGTNISELPNDLYIGWNLFIKGTPLAENYTVDEIRKMITTKGGKIIAKIFK